MSKDLSRVAIFTHVRELVEKLKMENNMEYQVVLYTSFGRIECGIAPPASESELLGFTDDPTEFTVDVSAIFDGKVDVFESHLINAVNVIIYNHFGEEISRVDQMMVFSDQILGFCIMKKR